MLRRIWKDARNVVCGSDCGRNDETPRDEAENFLNQFHTFRSFCLFPGIDQAFRKGIEQHPSHSNTALFPVYPCQRRKMTSTFVRSTSIIRQARPVYSQVKSVEPEPLKRSRTVPQALPLLVIACSMSLRGSWRYRGRTSPAFFRNTSVNLQKGEKEQFIFLNITNRCTILAPY